MPKWIFATLACAALSEEVEFDAGLSLLQTRAQKIDIDQEPTYFAKGPNSVCDDGEDLTLAQCLEILYTQKDVPNGNIESWGIMPNSRSHSGWKMPKGCYMAAKSRRLAWNDQPAGFPSRHYAPICSKQGGRAAEIASQGSSCQEPTCAEPPDDQRLNWEGDGVVVPEIEVLALGAVCEPCGILNYAQCAKATDTGLFTNLAGKTIKYQPTFLVSGGGSISHSRPSTPSGCFVYSNNYAGFSPYDTPDGALAGLVSDSGVGVGWAKYKPVCGVCTTTTPPPPPPVDEPEGDVAAAVADPHMATNMGTDYTLSDA